MAKMSKGQYQLLAEAIGDYLGEIRRRKSPLMENVVFGVANKLADYLAYDNRSFNRQMFMDMINSVAEVDTVTADLHDEDINWYEQEDK